jgi:hypothetical protein
MTYFKDEQEVYEYLGALFVGLNADPDLGPRFRKANMIVQYVYRKPDSRITIKMLEREEGQVDLGPTQLEPEVVMTMDADVAHRFWLGKANLRIALLRGQIRTHGPATKMLALAPLASQVFPRYRAQLEAAGRSDLLDVD